MRVFQFDGTLVEKYEEDFSPRKKKGGKSF